MVTAITKRSFKDGFSGVGGEDHWRRLFSFGVIIYKKCDIFGETVCIDGWWSSSWKSRTFEYWELYVREIGAKKNFQFKNIETNICTGFVWSLWKTEGFGK